MNVIFILIVCIPVLGYLLDEFLVYLNNTMWSDKLPEKLQGICPNEDYQRAQLYSKDNNKLSFWSSLFNLIALLLMLVFGGFAFVDNIARSIAGDNLILVALLFFAIIAAASDLINIPFSYYETFVIEKKYGFNTMNIKTFFADHIKSACVTVLIGIPVMWLITWFYYKTGKEFWLYAWALVTLFSLFMNLFYSELIVPLFNKQTPLPEGTLRSKIEDFSKKAGFNLQNIFIIDGSKRSTKSNAYFSGLGSKKRIVLYDTLMKDFSEEEIVSILGHEIGHYKKRHIVVSMVSSILLNGFMFFLFSLVVDNPAFSYALGAETPAFHLGLIVFGILYSPISTIIDVISNYISRRHEFEADKFSADNYPSQYLASALKKLSVKNLSNMIPHKVYVFFYYSHPPLLDRLARLE